MLILCPVGQLVASYRQRLPDTEFLRIDTVHAGLRIYREDEQLVQHSPPSSLRQYDAILLDECSQLDNNIGRKLQIAIGELPTDPFIGLAADYKQLQPVGQSGARESWCRLLPKVELNTTYRTSDSDLLDFLSCCRDNNPTRDSLFRFFGDRRWRRASDELSIQGVRFGLNLEKETGHPFVWLCVTNAGARDVCRAAIS